MHPVQPGWVACPVPNPQGEWFHVIGWTEDMQPVCAGQDRSVFVWRSEFGEDPFLIGTYEEWVG